MYFIPLFFLLLCCRANGVEKIFKLETALPKFSSSVVFYLIFSNMTTFKRVVDQIRSALNPDNPSKIIYHLIIIPSALYLYETALEELGLYSIIKLHSLQWLPLFLDEGIISLELPDMYRQLFVHQDLSNLSVYARSLWHLFFVLGRPNFVMALGHFANIVLKQLDTFCEDIANSDKFDSNFGGLIIVDRNLDYASALLTPGTYTALLNEVYGVKCGVCEYKVEGDIKSHNEKFSKVVQKQAVSFTLDSKQDSVYKDIKNRYFTEVISVLSNITKQLRTESVSSKEMALDEIKRYVQTQLHATKSRKKFVANHLSAAETIINIVGPRFEKQHEIEQNIMQNKSKSSNFSFLEEIITTENDKYYSLRLFCLMLITQKLSESEIKSFLKKYLNEFGLNYSFVYDNLLSAGFLAESSGISNLSSKIIKIPIFEKNNFYTNVNKLKQVPSDPSKIDLKFPTCCSYVYGGIYLPLIAQIASMLLNATPLDEVKAKLDILGNLCVKNELGYPLQPRSLLIYVIGGVTYAEIAACNLLEVLTGAKVTIISDIIVSGNSLMEGMLKLPDE